MATTNFTNGQTVIQADWCNDVDALRYDDNGSDLVKYQQGGTDSEVRTVGDKLRESVSVFDFMTAAEIAGCVAGTVDVTDAIAAAITALPANGGVLYFPQGVYKTDTITLPLYPKNISFIGAGRTYSVLTPKNSNTPLIVSAGAVTNYGGVRFEMCDMGIMPHASGSTGMAVDMRNMSLSLFEDVAFIQNGTATFDIGFELYSNDSAPYSHCYYNTFRDVHIVPTTAITNLPVKQAFKIFGSCGNHVIDRLFVSGGWPDLTRSAITIADYCRHNIVMNSNFEGLALTGGAIVINDAGYGNYHFNNYFENSGQPFYFAPETETGSREWSVVEKTAFAAGTLDSNTKSLVNGSVWRDNYAFGTDPTVLAVIRSLQINRDTYTVTASPDTGSITLSANTAAYSISDDKVVTVTGGLYVSGVSSPTGNVYINLPVTPANGGEYVFAGTINLYGTNAFTGEVMLRRQSGQGVAYIQYRDTSGNLQPAASLFKTGTTIELGFSYFAA